MADTTGKTNTGSKDETDKTTGTGGKTGTGQGDTSDRTGAARPEDKSGGGSADGGNLRPAAESGDADVHRLIAQREQHQAALDEIKGQLAEHGYV